MTENENNVRELQSARIKNSINDSFYAENVSWEGRIRTLRTYEEIIVRFILNKPEGSLLLGREKEELVKISNNNQVLMDSFFKIKKYGNEAVHAEKLANATEKDFDEVLDAIYGMYAYLFINYFEKFGISTKNRTLSMFSFLPPIIRFKTFDYLWKRDKNNPILIDKLSLAILKTFGIDKANEWINENANLLKQMPCTSEKAKQDLIQKVGKQVASKILDSGPQNMYDVCVSKVKNLSAPIEKYGPLYKTYEEAASFYKTKMHELEVKKAFSKEEIELKEIMDFCFEGRKEFSNDKDASLYLLSEIGVISRGVNE